MPKRSTNTQTTRPVPKAPKKKTSARSKPSTRKSPAPRRAAKRAKAPAKHMPVWRRNLIAVGIVIVFAAAFYYLYIQPYAYRRKACPGMEGYGVCMPRGYVVHGIDISHYQGNISWPTLALNRNEQYPIRFIFMKATEGGDFDDKTFARNFELAREYGFIRGAYHFFSPRTDVTKQADFFIKNVKLKSGDLPPVLDVEVLGKNTAKQLQDKVKYWLTRVEAHYGVKPIIYASYKFKIKYLSDPFFDDYPYWIAHYHVDAVRYTGLWHFWQHSDRGVVPGIKEQVDLNVFNGTEQELRELLIK